ncbi:sqd [Symbiodinium microadriaticum]|nr:sqd [Symbiodinium microadriaticum]
MGMPMVPGAMQPVPGYGTPFPQGEADRMKQAGGLRPKGVSEDKVTTVFVGGLRKSTSEDKVAAHFAKYGQVDSVDIKRLPDGTSRGFAFVKFTDKESVDKAVEAKANHMIDNKWVAVRPHGGSAFQAAQHAEREKMQVVREKEKKEAEAPLMEDDYEEKWSEKYLLQAASLRGADEDGEDGKDKDSGQMNPMMAMMMNPMMAMMMNPMMQMNPMMMGARPMMMPGCGGCGGCPGCAPGMPPGANGAPGGAQPSEDAGASAASGPDAAPSAGAPSTGAPPGATPPGGCGCMPGCMPACCGGCMPGCGGCCPCGGCMPCMPGCMPGCMPTMPNMAGAPAPMTSAADGGGAAGASEPEAAGGSGPVKDGGGENRFQPRNDNTAVEAQQSRRFQTASLVTAAQRRGFVAMYTDGKSSEVQRERDEVMKKNTCNTLSAFPVGWGRVRLAPQKSECSRCRKQQLSVPRLMAGRAVRQGYLSNGLFTSWMEELSAVVYGKSSEVPKKPSRRTRKNVEEARVVIEDFCQDCHAARVEPTPSELVALWERCSSFKSRHVAAAIGDQLSLQSGTDWQPRFRALCLLEQCFEEDSGASQLVATKVYEDHEEILKYLASNVQPCAEKAKKILHLCEAPPARPQAPPPTLPVPPMTPMASEPDTRGEPRSAPPVLLRRSARVPRNPERQALLSDVGEEPQKSTKEESETTASGGRSPAASSGDDDAKQALQDIQEELPFDPNVSMPSNRGVCKDEILSCALVSEAVRRKRY